MSDQDIIDTIAVVVGRHEYWQLLVSEDWECACGETALFKVEMDQHIASTIAAALRERYEIVEKVTSDHDPFDILCAVNRGGPTKSDTICPRCRPAKEADQ